MKSKKFIRINPHLPVKILGKRLIITGTRWDSMTNGSGPTITVKKPMAASGVMTCVYFFAEDLYFADVISTYPKSRLPLMWFVENIVRSFPEL